MVQLIITWFDGLWRYDDEGYLEIVEKIRKQFKGNKTEHCESKILYESHISFTVHEISVRKISSLYGTSSGILEVSSSSIYYPIDTFDQCQHSEKNERSFNNNCLSNYPPTTFLKNTIVRT